MRRWIPWALAVAAILHVAEEYACGWLDWARWYAPMVSLPPFLAVNAVFVSLTVAAAISRSTTLQLAIAGLVFCNAWIHIVPTVFLGSTSPGVITATVLYLPLGTAALVSAARRRTVPRRRAALAFLVGAALMTGPLVLRLVLPGASPVAVDEAPGAGDPEIEAVLRDVRRRWDLVGLGGGVLDGADDPRLAVVGWRKAGDPDPVELDDAWHIGSCTKALTATLAAKLVEEQRLRWQTTLAETFPERTRDLAGRRRAITLEQLLSHSAGLPHDPHVDLLGLRHDAVRQRLEVLRQLPRTVSIAAPGDRYSYSNFGYILAGAMIEHTVAQPFEVAMQTRLFAPLGLRDAWFEGTHGLERRATIWSHDARGRPIPRWLRRINDYPGLHPAGCLRCSLADWARFIRHHLVGEAGGSAYLRDETYRELHRRRVGDYALGWTVVERDWGGGAVLQHAGSNGWNFSAVWIAPRGGFAVFVCANQGECYAALDDAAGRLITLVRE